MKVLSLITILVFTFTGCNDTTNSDACGDGVVDIGEDCDGEAMNGTSCVLSGYYGGTIKCNSICRYDFSNCGGTCGDGIIQMSDGEICDGDNFGDAKCSENASLVCINNCKEYDDSACIWAECGDGILNIELGEECDGEDKGGKNCESFGYYGGELTCAGCNFDFLICTEFGMCGDNNIDEDFEFCDGDMLGIEDCQSLGFSGGEIQCNVNCFYDTSGCIE